MLPYTVKNNGPQRVLMANLLLLANNNVFLSN